MLAWEVQNFTATVTEIVLKMNLRDKTAIIISVKKLDGGKRFHAEM